ncbi:hypothetical protein EDF46_0463 [Frondihabitans sp. PhB188]|uniref:hypothetical protein n=1 Tax=Frondihabitans sp. PhB188 TaxID=2485200 RepID=UPI000F93B2C2|nr:hypothetical protein [Frondihabitans sp. PhB188]ROQ41092.1 hypothetical protein EDF46_0463 [Frondihabitans sp. PhB188]
MTTRIRRRLTGSLLTGAAATSMIVAGPVSARASEATHAEVTVPLVADCSTLTDRGRAYFRANDIQICGVGGSSRGVVSGNCGTSTIYVDRLGSGRGRVSWSIFAGGGSTMVFRNIAINWGPAAGGSFADVSPMAGLAYSKSRLVNGKGKLKASISGSVKLVGKYLTCTIPRHEAASVTL